jgi:hypothetical protein
MQAKRTTQPRPYHRTLTAEGLAFPDPCQPGLPVPTEDGPPPQPLTSRGPTAPVSSAGRAAPPPPQAAYPPFDLGLCCQAPKSRWRRPATVIPQQRPPDIAEGPSGPDLPDSDIPPPLRIWAGIRPRSRPRCSGPAVPAQMSSPDVEPCSAAARRLRPAVSCPTVEGEVLMSTTVMYGVVLYGLVVHFLCSQREDHATRSVGISTDQHKGNQATQRETRARQEHRKKEKRQRKVSGHATTPAGGESGGRPHGRLGGGGVGPG